MKKVFKTILKILGAILGVVIIACALIYFLVLQYPNLKENPEIGKWYRVTTSEMKTSQGDSYRAFFKKGSENKVMIYFAGGGVSINEETAASDGCYNKSEIGIDYLANITMNMGGLASSVEDSEFENWTIILFPYATGDFHCGSGEYYYTDADGNDKILYHYGYINYTEAMNLILEKAGIDNPDTVLVTGYSAGGFAAALLADDVYTNYFPNAANKNVLVDASLLLNDNWHDIAVNVWHAPESITEKIVSDNITLDCLKALNDKYGSSINLMFDCSTRDGDLSKVQNYFDNGVFDVDESIADKFQEILKEAIVEFQENNVSLFIWDGLPWYDDPRNMTMHTIIATPYVWITMEEQNQSVAGWVVDTIYGNKQDYGIELVNKTY